MIELYETNPAQGPDGTHFGAPSVVVREFAEAILNLLLVERLSTVLEIGMAQWLATLLVASAVRAEGWMPRVWSLDR